MMNEENENIEYSFFKNTDMDRIGDNTYMRPIFDSILSKYSFDSVLDYGCGNGIFGIYFKKKINCKLIGVDASGYGLKKAKELGYDETIQINDFCTGELPFDNEFFDLVLLKDILEHLLDPYTVLKEAIRVLKVNGLLLLHVPNHFPLKYRIKFLFTNRIDTQNYFPDADEWNFPHIRFFTSGGLKNKLNEMGIEIIENYSDFFTTFCPVISHILYFKSFQRYLAKRFPDDFSYGYTYLCKKLSR